MTTYYFHLCDGSDTLIDPDGREISDIALIEPVALREARAIIGQEAVTGSIKLAQWIDVLDESGSSVHRLAFCDAVTIQN